MAKQPEHSWVRGEKTVYSDIHMSPRTRSRSLMCFTSAAKQLSHSSDLRAAPPWAESKWLYEGGIIHCLSLQQWKHKSVFVNFLYKNTMFVRFIWMSFQLCQFNFFTEPAIIFLSHEHSGNTGNTYSLRGRYMLHIIPWFDLATKHSKAVISGQLLALEPRST